MRRRDAALLLVLVGLGLAAAVLAASVAERYQAGGRLRAEVGRVKLSRLQPETLRRLVRLEDRLVLTYYVTERARMPSSMKRVEAGVTDLLRAMEAAAPGVVEYHVVDPDTDPDLVGYASKRRIAPFRVRSVSRDAWSEELVWSALSISYGTHREAVVGGIGPQHLPRLQRTILEHLDQMTRPRAPEIALAAPRGFLGLHDALAGHGRVHDVDLDGGEPFPTDADVLFWMEPRAVTPARLREIERFLESGRSLVVAGSRWTAGPDAVVELDGEPALALERSDFQGGALYAELGLRAIELLPLDERAESIRWPPDARPAAGAGEPVPAPFLLRCIAPNQDFMRWRGQPNGTLLFAAATPFALEPDVLGARGYLPEILATTSDRTWLQPPPLARPRPLSLMGPEHGDPASKLPLVVALRPADPWQGSVVAFAAATPFADGTFAREGTAHWRLVDVLVRELASDERLVAASTEVRRPSPTPELSAGSRLAWRALVILLAPALLAGLAIARGVHRSGVERRPRGARRLAGALLPRLAVALAAVVLVPRLAEPLGLLADATEEDLSRLAPATRALAAEAGETGEIRVELVFSDRDRLPPALRPLVGRLRGVLRDLERAGARLAVEIVRLDALAEDELDDLERDGIRAVQVATHDDESVTVRTIRGAARLSRGGRVEVLPFTDPADFESLEFRLAFALWRLETGERPLVAFAADAKRPSPAEAYEDYQQQGLFAPMGTDRYGVARELLERSGFRVASVTPRDFMADPEVPPDAAAIVWMQPRRSIEKMLDRTLRHLVGGGKVMIAAQHFNIQSRQYRGRGFRMSYWPQPQTPDIDRIYFPGVGIELVREVLFDELAFEVESDARIAGRGRGREYDRQASARPFQIRASAAHFAAHPITRGLGDQAFLGASPIRLDRERLLELGLDATVLATTSPRTWTYAWTGGFLEEDEGSPLVGPPLDEEGRPAWAGPLPLAVLVEGAFPPPEEPLLLPRVAPGAAPPPDGAAGGLDDEPWPASRPGELLLVGCSEVFTDRLIRDSEFRGDHLLLSSVAHLALPPELAAVASRRPVARGLGYVPPDERLLWRSAVLATPPAAILFLALVWHAARAARPPRRSAP